MSVTPNYWANRNQQPVYYSNTPNYYQQLNQNIFAWVQGDAGAAAYMVPPNVTAFLMDSEKPIVYMKSADANGRPSNIEKRYLVTEDQYSALQNSANNQNGSNFVTKEDLENAIKSLDDKFVIKRHGGKDNGK